MSFCVAQAYFPSSLEFANISQPINQAIDQILINHIDTFDAFSEFILQSLLSLENFLSRTPWWAIIGFLFIFTWLCSRSFKASLTVSLAFLSIGVLGFWDKGIQSLSIVLICLIINTFTGIPLGIAMSISPLFKRNLMIPVLDILQTMPSFVFLVPGIMFFGLGKVPAIIATVIYAMPPLARFTNIGIESIDSEIIEAAKAMGAHPVVILFRIQLPLALASILGGLNQSIMLSLSMIVVASLVGARGLGEPILFSIQRLNVGLGVQAGIAITLMAITFDRLTQAIGKRFSAIA